MAHSVSVESGGRVVIIKPIIPINLGKKGLCEAGRHAPYPKIDAPIDVQKIRAALKTDGADLGICPEFRPIQPQFDVHVFESLPSTSTQLWKMLALGAGSGTVVIAQHQTSGRGQRGRTWQSAPGGLYLSLALEPDWPIAHSALLTYCSAWGIATALNNLGLPVQIKWPNDLFFAGKKLGGILTETKLAQSKSVFSPENLGGKPLPCIKQAVIGVGINWHNLVPETGITLAKIQKLMPDSAARSKLNCLEVLAALVLKGILQGLYFQQRVGSQVFIKAYSNLLTQVGKAVSMNHSSLSADASESLFLQQPSPDADKGRAVNCSGKIIGISEEGYLQVSLGQDVICETMDRNSQPRSHILLLKPSEIHVD